jgi:acyl-CoA thioesterase-1
MRQLLTPVLFALMLAASLAPAVAEAAGCQVPEDLKLVELSLPATRNAVTTRKALTILTIGGSSTAGLVAKGEEYTYPARLGAQLRMRFPALQVEVINRGVKGGTTRARVDRLAGDLRETHPDLVIWAPGSTEAGMSENPGAFIDSLQDGVAAIHSAEADLIMIDLQWAPSIARVIDLAQYNNAIAGVAVTEDIAVLRRSELMRRWNDDGTLRFDATSPPARRLADIRLLFDCIAGALADGIAQAVR